MNKILNLNINKDSNVYLISDIHANLELFKKILNDINFSHNDYLFILGDIIEKGDYSLDTLSYIRSLILNDYNIYITLGNCDNVINEFVKPVDANKLYYYSKVLGHTILNEFFEKLNLDYKNESFDINQNIDKINKLKYLKVMQNKSQNNRLSENINKNFNNPFESNILNEIDNEQYYKQTFKFNNNANINKLMLSMENKNPEDIFNNLPSESSIQNNNINFSKEIKDNQLNNNQFFSVESYKIDSNISNNNNINNMNINKQKRKKLIKDFKINSQIDENDFSDVDFLD
jgi:Icc-related predicted phosphoesterase